MPYLDCKEIQKYFKYTQRYNLGGNKNKHVFSEKDIGVTIDSKLTFDAHISKYGQLGKWDCRTGEEKLLIP